MHPLTWILLLFLLALLVAHLPVILVKRRYHGIIPDKDAWTVWWERSDYLSIGLATIALIPAANEIRRIFGGIELSERLHNVAYSHSQKFAKSMLGHYERFPPAERNLAVTTELVGGLKAHEAGDPALDRAKELLRNSRVDEAQDRLRAAIKAYDQFLQSEPQVDPKALFATDAKMVRGGVQGQRDYAAELLERSFSVKKGIGEILLALVSPYLLAVAFAVRLGKVSAKLLLEEQKRLPPRPTDGT